MAGPHENDDAAAAAAVAQGNDDKNKTPRHPRWTRQETLILIQGKKVAENRGGKGRRSSSMFLDSDQIEPKWDLVSSYCNQQGVGRGPVQCRKRWSNLVSDFRKIKAWELQAEGEELESFWMMRNDSRKAKKLPGIFDRELYDVLDGRPFSVEAYPLAICVDGKDGDIVLVEEEDEEEENEAIFDSCRPVTTADDSHFSDFEQWAHKENGRKTKKERVATTTGSPPKRIPSPVPNSEKYYEPFHQDCCYHGVTKENNPGSCFCSGSTSPEAWKRRRMSTAERQDIHLEGHLIKVLEKNSSILNAQLETQNKNCQLDRDRQKEQNDSLVAALSKIANALERIADKL